MTFYIASKTKHAAKWRNLRDKGYNIISTWIDESEIGQTLSKTELYTRCINEATQADFTILYVEPGEESNFALIEVGAALGAGKKIILIGQSKIIDKLIFHPNASFSMYNSVDATIHSINYFGHNVI